jgi:hypothetical protein
MDSQWLNKRKTGDLMDAPELAEQAKKQNIIDMALGFTAMTPSFREGSADLIRNKIADSFEELDRVRSNQDFSKMHMNFCMWFVKTIRLVEGEETPAYGHAAKVLDLALKVYVYYCKMPNQARAELLTPWLNGAIDTHVLRHLHKKLKDYGKTYPPHYSWTIKLINKEEYDLLQKVILQEIKDSFDGSILPVQYGDIIGRRLDRFDK